MAALWEMLVGAAIDSTDPSKGPKFAESWARGAQLAQQKEDLQLKRQQLELQKKQVEGAKMDKMVEAIQKGANYEGQARTNYYNKWLPTYRDSLGLTEAFPNDTLKHITADDSQLARFNTIVAQVRDPNSGVTEAMGIALINDRVKFGEIPPEVREDFTNKLAEAAKTNINAKAQMATIAAQDRRQKVDIAATGPKTVAAEVGKEFAKYEAIGGSAGMDKTEAALKKAIKKLERGEVQTGTAALKVPYGSDPRVLARVNPKVKELQDSIFSTQNLKAMSGDPNPTERQIQDIRAFAFDPMADNQANIGKLKAQLKQVQSDRVRKETQFTQAGYMQPRTQAPATEKETAPAGGAQRGIQDFDNPNKVKLIRAYVQKGDTQLNEIASKYGLSPKALLKLLQE